MVTVYLAEDLKPRRRVALKVLKPELAAVVGSETKMLPKGGLMRMMVRWTAETKKTNEAIDSGAGMDVIESMLRELEPEAAYLFTNQGRRSGLMVFDMADSSQIPRIAEPLFLAFNADVEFVPVMNPDDLRAAFESE